MFEEAAVESSCQLLDFFGDPRLDGQLYALGECRLGAKLVEAADGASVRLGYRLSAGLDEAPLDQGRRSRPVEAEEKAVRVSMPIEIPARPGSYLLELELVVEGKCWVSWFGMMPVGLQVERLPDGGVVAHETQDGREYRIENLNHGKASTFQISHPLYGRDDSERCVEILWVLSRYRGERRVVDVGYAFAEQRYLDALTTLEIPLLVGLDLATEARDFLKPIVADARRPGLLPGSIDLIHAISVIEHVGRDSRLYPAGVPDQAESNGDFAAIGALAELLAPGGRILLTVPYGRLEDHGWFVQYDEARLAELVRASQLDLQEAEFFWYQDGWRGPVAQSELATCRYGDMALAAAGVACIALRRTG